MNIALAGGGSWGTAMARLLSKKGHKVNFYIRNQTTINNILESGENSKYLPGIKIPKNIYLSNDIIKSVEGADVLVLAVPTSAVRVLLTSIKDKLNSSVIIVNLSKGIEIDSLKRISEVTGEILPDNPFVALSGPSHAEEVGKDIPTTVVASSTDVKYANIIQDQFSTDNFRIYTNTDLIGVEIGGALKNIIALAAGISDGLGFGDNTKAALMTRGMYEMSKMGLMLGANPHTFNGLSGMGDLIVTCTSMHSRNRRAGILIGKGRSIEQATKEVGQVVEGIKTTKSAYQLAKKHNIEMPISQSLYQVLYNGKDPKDAVNILMTRKKKEEIEQIFFE